jgi:hypothetical protein
LLKQLLNLLMKALETQKPTPTIASQPKSLLELLNPENIKACFGAKDYKFFDTPDRRLNLNIVGVRRDNQGTNTFDDFLLVMYREDEAMISHRYQITTDPGKYWLLNPMNPKGTAVLKPGQYRSTWQLGKHQGKYEALVQRKPVQVYRDNSKDEVIDYNNIATAIDEGYFGINIHRSNPYDQSYTINKWSAGCQVFKKVEDFNDFMDLCRQSAKLYGPSFTYTLIHEKDLRKHANG